jgi:hypothetical protein
MVGRRSSGRIGVDKTELVGLHYFMGPEHRPEKNNNAYKMGVDAAIVMNSRYRRLETISALSGILLRLPVI